MSELLEAKGAWKGTLVSLLGIEFVEVTRARVIAELAIRDELRTVGGALHGGALMAFADTIGAVATIANLSPGSTTSTLEPGPISRERGGWGWCGQRQCWFMSADVRWFGRPGSPMKMRNCFRLPRKLRLF